jgi:hypothetical protein
VSQSGYRMAEAPPGASGPPPAASARLAGAPAASSSPAISAYFNDASFCAWLALLDDRTSKSFLIAVTTQADAAGQVSECGPSEILGSRSARLLFSADDPAKCRSR